MKNNNEVKVHLTLTSEDLSPHEVTARTGLQPHKHWEVGDLIPGTTASYKINGWSLSSDLTNEAALEDHLDSLLTTIRPAIPVFQMLSEHWNIELSCAIYVRSHAPSCHFNPAAVQELGLINAHIDIDLYFLNA